MKKGLLGAAATAAVIGIFGSSGDGVIELGELPRVSHTWIAGIEGDRDHVFIAYETTKEYDDEDYFRSAGLMRMDFAGDQRQLASFDRPPGNVAIDDDHVYISHRGVRALRRSDGGETMLHPPARIYGRAGDELIIGSGGDVAAVHTVTGAQRTIAPRLKPAWQAALSPRYLYLSRSEPSLLRIDLQSGKQRRVAKADDSYHAIVAGHGRVAASGMRWVARIVRQQATIIVRDDVQLVALAVDDSHVYYRRGYGSIWRVSVEGGDAESFVEDQGYIARAVIAGDRLVWTVDNRVFAKAL